MWWLPAVALAHPVGDRAAAQSTALVVHPDRVDVEYQADVPTILVQTARVGGDPIAAMATELESGLLLVVDGRVVSMTERAPSPPPVVGPHSVTFTVHLGAALPLDARTIELQTANLPEAANFYSGDVHLGGGLRIEACSLLALDGGRIARDDTLRWRRGDENRTLSVTLAPTPWWRAVVPAAAEPVSARSASRSGDRTAIWAGAAFAAAFAAGTALWWRRR